MLALSAILAASRLTLPEIAASAVEGSALANLYDIAGGSANPSGRFFRFINAYVSNVAGSTRQQAALAYRQAAYWTQQGQLLSQLDQSIVVDRRLAFVKLVDADDYIPGQNYRYAVDVTITFPGSGDVRTFGVWIYRSQPTTLEGAYSEAIDALAGRFRPRSTPIEYGGEMDDWSVSFQLQSFTSIQVRT